MTFRRRRRISAPRRSSRRSGVVRRPEIAETRVLDLLGTQNSRDSVRFTVPGDGSHSEGPARPPGSSSPAPVDEIGARVPVEAMFAEPRASMYARAHELDPSHFDADDIVHDALMRAMSTTAVL